MSLKLLMSTHESRCAKCFPQEGEKILETPALPYYEIKKANKRKTLFDVYKPILLPHQVKILG